MWYWSVAAKYIYVQYIAMCGAQWKYVELSRVDCKPGGGLHVVVWCWWMSKCQV